MAQKDGRRRRVGASCQGPGRMAHLFFHLLLLIEGGRHFSHMIDGPSKAGKDQMVAKVWLTSEPSLVWEFEWK
jgi:hypothetical protein